MSDIPEPIPVETPADPPTKKRRGIQCRSCGCRDLRVLETRQSDGYIVRRRICRNCGKRCTTREQIL